MNNILTTCKFVVDNAKHITINNKKIDHFIESFKPDRLQHWIDDAPFNIHMLSPDEKLHFLLLFNSLSFSYWGSPKWAIEYKGETYDGAYGMVACIARALENNFPILDPRYLKTISRNDLVKILEGNITIPLFEERLNILREIGRVLTDSYDGSFLNMIREADNDTQKLIEIITTQMPSFEDVALYKNKRIYFQKRPQLLIADVYQAFNGEGYGKFSNVNELTACADYKLPLVLREIGILRYDDELSSIIDTGIFLNRNDSKEIELRAVTIWVIHLITEKLRVKIPTINALSVNDHIWLLSQDKQKFSAKYHYTRTTAY